MQRRRQRVPQTQPARDEFLVRRIEQYVYDSRHGRLVYQRCARQPGVDRRLRLGARGPAGGKRESRHLSENHGHLRPERLGRTHGDHLPARLRRGERRHCHQTGERHLRMEALRQRTAVRRVGPAETERRIRSQPPHPLHQGRRHGEIHRFGDPDGRPQAAIRSPRRATASSRYPSRAPRPNRAS